MAKKVNTGRNLYFAVPIGLFLGLLVVLAVSFKPVFWWLLLSIAFGVAILELGSHFEKKFIGYSRFFSLLLGEILLAVSYFFSYQAVLAFISGEIIIVFFSYLLYKNYTLAKNLKSASLLELIGTIFLSLFWIFIPGLLAVDLIHFTNGKEIIISFILVVVFADIGGYFSGIFLGKHLLSPLISPKKTWEGLLGSLIFSNVVGFIFLQIFFDFSIWKIILFSTGLVFIGILGDLFESQIKRELKIKDMGSILPGHGGIMDRLDSLLPGAVFVWIVFSFLMN